MFIGRAPRLSMNIFAAFLLERGELQDKILVLCEDTRITDFHRFIAVQISRTRNRSFLLSSQIVRFRRNFRSTRRYPVALSMEGVLTNFSERHYRRISPR